MALGILAHYISLEITEDTELKKFVVTKIFSIFYNLKKLDFYVTRQLQNLKCYTVSHGPLYFPFDMLQ